jgi:hypothetical protein
MHTGSQIYLYVNIIMNMNIYAYLQMNHSAHKNLHLAMEKDDPYVQILAIYFSSIFASPSLQTMPSLLGSPVFNGKG